MFTHFLCEIHTDIRIDDITARQIVILTPFLSLYCIAHYYITSHYITILNSQFSILHSLRITGAISLSAVFRGIRR